MITSKYSELLLAHNQELEAKQEKFAALLVQHDDELNKLMEVLPEMRAELLAATLPDLTAKLDATIPQMVVEKVGEEAGALAATTAKRIGEIRDELEKLAREKLTEVQAERQRTVTLDEVRETLAAMAKQATEDTARRLLIGNERELEAKIAAHMEALPQARVEMAATASLADAYRGAFAVGLRAERGEIWTWLGSAYICLETTGEPPQRRNARVGRGAWGLLASSGSGSGGGGSGGDSLPSQAGNNGKFLTTDGSAASWATLAGGGDMLGANNLSDVADAATAFDTIKQPASTTYAGAVALGTGATYAAAGNHLHTGVYDPAGTGASEAAAAIVDHVAESDPHVQYALESALGGAAVLNVGTTAGTVAAGNDARFTDARTPTAHASTHTNGTDDIQSATAAQKGLATAAQITKLDGIEDGADVTDASNVAAAGAVMVGGALGTPSSGTLTSCTGLPLATGVTGTLQAAQMPSITGDVWGTVGSLTTTITANAVTNAKLANMAEYTIKARKTAGTGDPEDCSVEDIQYLLGPTGFAAYTGTITLQLTDSYKYVTVTTAGATVIYVPTNASVSFKRGTIIWGEQGGAGVQTFTGIAGSVTINCRGAANKTAGTYALWSLVHTSTTNVWTLSGDVTT